MSGQPVTSPGGLRGTFARVAPASILVQLLSFGSSIALAIALGPSSATDAYYLALSVPAVVYAVLLAAIRLGGVPALTNVANEGDVRGFARSSSEIVTGTTATAAAVSIVVIGVMLVVLPAAAGTSAHVSALTREFMVELWPYAITGAMLGVLGAVLSVRGKFAISALVLGLEPLVKSILLLLFHRQLGAQTLVLGNVIGNVLAVAVLWEVLRRDGIRVTFVPFRHSRLVRRVLMVSAPLLISQSVLQLNPLIDRTTAASLGAGSVTIFQLGLRLFTAPALVLSATIAAPLAATWSARLVQQGWDAVASSFARVMVAVVSLLPPLVVVGLILRRQVVQLAYSSHVYSPAAVGKTANVFGMLALGLVAQLLIAPLATLFIIRQQTVFPMLVGIANCVLNGVLDVLLRGPLGVAGIALSTTVTLTILCVVYAVEAHRRWGLGHIRPLITGSVVAATASSAVATVSGILLLRWLHPAASRLAALEAIVLVVALVAILHWIALVIAGVPMGQRQIASAVARRPAWSRLRSAASR